MTGRAFRYRVGVVVGLWRTFVSQRAFAHYRYSRPERRGADGERNV